MYSLDNKTMDILHTIINKGMKKGAEALNAMVESTIVLKAPLIKFVEAAEIENNIGVGPQEKISSVKMNYEDALSGAALLIFSTDAAAKLVSLITQDIEPGFDMDYIKAGTLSEIGNVVINAIIGTMSNSLEFHLSYTVPEYVEGNISVIQKYLNTSENSKILLVRCSFFVEKIEISGDLALFLSMENYEYLLSSIRKHGDV